MERKENCRKIRLNSCNGCPVIGVASEMLIANGKLPARDMLRIVGKDHCPENESPIIEGDVHRLAINNVKLNRNKEIFGSAAAGL